MPERASDAAPRVTPAISLCETASPWATVGEIEAALAETCQEAGFPYCERVYVGSYFCENYFLSLTDAFHDAVREICARYEMGATLVIPIIGQAFLGRATGRIAKLLERYGDVYDEVVVNDVGMFADLISWMYGNESDAPNTRADGRPIALPRIGLGRLFSKERRDPRYPEVFDAPGKPSLSAEAASCLALQARANPGVYPLVEIDPTNAIVDVSDLAGDFPARESEIAIHLPLCYATTGRNCGPASVDEPDSEKFRLGRECPRHCLRMAQGYLTDEGVRYVKHGRTYYFENPACQISGVGSWRIIYAATHETMR